MPQTDASQERTRSFLRFVQQHARAMRSADGFPDALDDWQIDRASLRRKLIRSWGGFPAEPCPLEVEVVGKLQREGYHIEKLTLQTRPGVRMTANLYVPQGAAKNAAVLCVHGHFQLAKSEPTVQSRCIGLAKLGFVVLMVDAFGAGERGIGKALGEYHGEMVAGTLWPTGLALAGLQVYENMRAVDYLQSRPEVDPDRIGVTGCSGGGNQTMYAGAIDERLKCVVPVCSVGTYQAYLGAACCMCEVTPGALSYTEESGVLALVAPRALMLINATRDGFQFSVGEAKKSLAAARNVFRLYNKENRTRHVVVDSTHGYNKEMREAMYGWMTKHLKGEGDGAPIAEPPHQTEDAETLRCFPGDSRPDAFITVPKFAAMEAKRILKRYPTPDHIERWQADETLMRESLPRVLGRFPKAGELDLKVSDAGAGTAIAFDSEPGVRIHASHFPVDGKGRKIAILLDLDRGRDACTTPLSAALTAADWDVVTVDLRATASTAVAGDAIRRAPDHNSAEWSMWIGRSLLGQWVGDVRRLLEALDQHLEGLPKGTAVVGTGPASLIALCTAALDSRIERIATVGGLASYVSDLPYEKQRLGIMVPGILRDVGDINRIASLCSPRRLIVADPIDGSGEPLSSEHANEQFAWTRAAYQIEGQPSQVRILVQADAKSIASELAGSP